MEQVFIRSELLSKRAAIFKCDITAAEEELSVVNWWLLTTHTYQSITQPTPLLVFVIKKGQFSYHDEDSNLAEMSMKGSATTV